MNAAQHSNRSSAAGSGRNAIVTLSKAIRRVAKQTYALFDFLWADKCKFLYSGMHWIRSHSSGQAEAGSCLSADAIQPR
jgi:hypothetical protein